MFVLTLAVSGSQGVCNKRQEKQSSTCYDKMLPVPLDSLDCLQHSIPLIMPHHTWSQTAGPILTSSVRIKPPSSVVFERSDLVLYADTLALRHGVVLSMLWRWLWDHSHADMDHAGPGHSNLSSLVMDHINWILGGSLGVFRHHCGQQILLWCHLYALEQTVPGGFQRKDFLKWLISSSLSFTGRARAWPRTGVWRPPLWADSPGGPQSE